MPWTDITRRQHNRDDLRYPSDLRDGEWAVIEPFLPPARPGGRPRTTNLREVVKPLGAMMARRLLDALGGDPARIEGYGKGAIVGAAGELEHGALWHNPGGYAMRELLGEERSRAIVPSTKKVAGPGARIDIPITHANASYVRSHFDAIEVGIADAPRAGEMLLVLAMTTGPRVHARSGGLEAAQIAGKDGLR